MKVTVKLFASLRKDRFEGETREFRENTTVGAVRESLGIDKSQRLIVLVNGIHAESDHILQDGDTLAFFPPSGGG